MDTLSRMRQIVGTSAQWTANNIVLGDGEIGVEVIDAANRRVKVGDGVRTWSALPWSGISQAALDAEIANRAAGDATLTTNLAAETSARIAADTAEATARGNADSAETGARTAADTTLQTNINSETNARVAGDNAEITARTNADNALDVRLDVLEAGASGTAADLAEIEAGLAAETAARANADTALDARLDAIEAQNLDARVSVLEDQVASLPPPPWVRRAVIGGAEKVARLHVRFPTAEYWADGIRNFGNLIDYRCDATKLYCADDGSFKYAGIDEPVITALGLESFVHQTSWTKYNRDLRVQYRCNMSGLSSPPEFFTDGDAVTTSAGGAGNYIDGEAAVLKLTNWTGAPPASGQTLTGPNAVVTIGTTTPYWIWNNVSVTRDQPGLDGTPNMACRVTALAANATISQAITLASSTRRTVAFMRRAAGAGEIALGVDGIVWAPCTVTSPQWARYSGDQQTLANPRPGIRLAVSGDQVVVDLFQMPDRGPTQAECYRPGQTGGLGTAFLPQTTPANLIVNSPDSVCSLRRAVPSFVADPTRFTVTTRLTTLTGNPGGAAIQFDTDGTSRNVAVQNWSTVGTASNNNFGITYKTDANPAGFGNDPAGPKATANLPHTLAWTMNANDVGGGMALCMIAADGSAARVNVDHPPEHFPRGLQYMRIGSQWGLDLDPLVPSYNHGNCFIFEFAVFDGVPSATELEAMAPGSQLPGVAAALAEPPAAELLAAPEDGTPSITFICPRSAPGKPRRCSHAPGEWSGAREAPTLARPIDCPGCGWRGTMEKGVLVPASAG